MKKKLQISLLLAGTALFIAGAHAEEPQQPHTTLQWLTTFDRMKEVAPVTNSAYAEECGSCHFAYPPGLLPEGSWNKLLDPAALQDHFGENAELDEDVLKTIQDYAKANSAEKSWYKRSRKIALATEGIEPPLRITETRYIKRKHHEIPKKMITENPDVKSQSNCTACHTQAEKGIFNSDTVDIPNYAQFEEDED